MAEQARLRNAVAALNDALDGVTPYRLAAVSPGEVDPLDKNAHYMPKRVFDQLAENIKKDGNLSSLPLLWRKADGSLECLSGNHRVMAAKAAGVETILCLVTDAELSVSEKRAIQLSHNSLVGKDDPAILREVWSEIDDLTAKIYSGLDDDLIGNLPNPEPIQLRDDSLVLEELTLLFMPSEIDRIESVCEHIGVSERRRLAAPLELFDRFFDALLGFKEAKGILNTGVAFWAMVEMVEAHLRGETVEGHQSSATVSQ